jgi:hypothetical protein
VNKIVDEDGSANCPADAGTSRFRILRLSSEPDLGIALFSRANERRQLPRVIATLLRHSEVPVTVVEDRRLLLSLLRQGERQQRNLEHSDRVDLTFFRTSQGTEAMRWAFSSASHALLDAWFGGLCLSQDRVTETGLWDDTIARLASLSKPLEIMQSGVMQQHRPLIAHVGESEFFGGEQDDASRDFTTHQWILDCEDLYERGGVARDVVKV